MSFQTEFNEIEKLWSAIDRPSVFDSRISLGHALLWSLGNNPNKIIQINHETNIQLTAGYIRSCTMRASVNLQQLGCKVGDVFGLIAKNSHFVAPIVYASLCIGCPLSTLDPSFSKAEILHMLSITKPTFMFCDSGMYELLQECLNELENDATVFTFSGQVGDSIPVENLFQGSTEAENFSPVDLDGENTVGAIVCTSGSTGLSKGVCLSHASLLYQATYFLADANNVVLTFSTVYWISGLLLAIAGGLKGFCRVITTENFTPELLLKMIEEHRITIFFSASYSLVQTLKCEMFHKTDLSSIRLILCGGSKLSISTALEMLKYLKNAEVLQMYGMSEVAGLTSCCSVVNENDTSVGKLKCGIKIKICDDDGQRLGINESGEIHQKTKYKFLGYINNEQATRDTLDEEGFLRTGDIGYFDVDNNLYLVDRKKDLMKYCNSQISPTEIEQFLIKYPSISAVCVVGIPDPYVGDLPAAVIVQKDSETPMSREEVEQIVADHFADYKRLRGGVYFVESLPLTPSGKIIRRCARDIAIEMYKRENNVTDD